MSPRPTPLTADKFIAHNPGQIKQLPGPPARVLPVTLAIPLGEEKFKNMLNIVSQSLLDTGFYRTGAEELSGGG